MHISPSIDMNSDHTTTLSVLHIVLICLAYRLRLQVFSRMSPIAKSLPPATQIDIIGILQREQDHAMALLSSSPLLASLFVSYANQAAVLHTVTPSAGSEDWKALENTITGLQGEIDKLKPENLEMTERLAEASAALEAFRSQAISLKEVNMTQLHEIDSLRAELLKSKDKYNRLVEDSNAEKDAFRNMVSDLKVCLVFRTVPDWKLNVLVNAHYVVGATSRYEGHNCQAAT